jgi:uncharacterized protein (TIGR03086 family)
MSETSQRYARVADAFAARIIAVPADAWDNPSPCEGWTARDVVRHVIEATEAFLKRADHPLGDIPSVDDEPGAAFAAASAKATAALEDPAVAEKPIKSGMGDMTLEKMFGMFGVGDVLIHTWDLSRAAGLDERLDAEEVDRIFAVMQKNDKMLRGGTAFGDAVEPPPGADKQTQLLCFTGRQV